MVHSLGREEETCCNHSHCHFSRGAEKKSWHPDGQCALGGPLAAVSLRSSQSAVSIQQPTEHKQPPHPISSLNHGAAFASASTFCFFSPSAPLALLSSLAARFRPPTAGGVPDVFFLSTTPPSSFFCRSRFLLLLTGGLAAGGVVLVEAVAVGVEVVRLWDPTREAGGGWVWREMT